MNDKSVTLQSGQSIYDRYVMLSYLSYFNDYNDGYFCKPTLTLLYDLTPHAGWTSGKVKPTLVTSECRPHPVRGPRPQLSAAPWASHRTSGDGWSPKRTHFCFGVLQCSGNGLWNGSLSLNEKHTLLRQTQTHTHAHVHANPDHGASKAELFG